MVQLFCSHEQGVFRSLLFICMWLPTIHLKGQKHIRDLGFDPQIWAKLRNKFLGLAPTHPQHPRFFAVALGRLAVNGTTRLLLNVLQNISSGLTHIEIDGVASPYSEFVAMGPSLYL